MKHISTMRTSTFEKGKSIQMTELQGWWWWWWQSSEIVEYSKAVRCHPPMLKTTGHDSPPICHKNIMSQEYFVTIICQKNILSQYSVTRIFKSCPIRRCSKPPDTILLQSVTDPQWVFSITLLKKIPTCECNRRFSTVMGFKHYKTQISLKEYVNCKSWWLAYFLRPFGRQKEILKHNTFRPIVHITHRLALGWYCFNQKHGTLKQRYLCCCSRNVWFSFS